MVFGVGQRKTGVGALGHMLRMVYGDAAVLRTHERRHVAKLLARGNELEALERLRASKVFVSAPFAGGAASMPLYMRLARRFHSARFVLTERSSAAWWPSVWRSTTCTKPWTKVEVMRSLGAKTYTEADMVAAYERHAARVHAFFADELRQPWRLLRLGLTDRAAQEDAAGRWRCLCAFVGVPAESCPASRSVLPVRRICGLKGMGSIETSAKPNKATLD